MPNFYPRPPRGGRPLPWAAEAMSWAISIHALREEGDPHMVQPHRGRKISIHALREEGDPCIETLLRVASISIHALREEGDKPSAMSEFLLFYFYPRPPRGGRQQKQRQNLYFQTNYTTFCTNLEEP